jgi:hypothetical protein
MRRLNKHPEKQANGQAIVQNWGYKKHAQRLPYAKQEKENQGSSTS